MEIEEESKQYTAFTLGPPGFFECNRMPFGATNAPATFQILMKSCLGDLNLNWCIIYLDDVVVYAPTVKEHLKGLEGVFQKLKSAGLKLKPTKCELFKQSISYLGHVVSEEGVQTDPKKIAAVKEWERPHNVHSEKISWICELLQEIHQGLFKDSQTTLQFDFRRQCQKKNQPS